MAPALVQLWYDWGIQILVLSSFTLQVMLLAFAGIRRRKSSAPLRILLWLMYLLADSTALYTLGHLSVASGSARDLHLVAFWAPFLLVHLGGPGNITAYSLEDNQLWRRHLLTLVVQVMGAAFVIYKYVAGAGALLLLAAVLVFIVGVLRYGERTYALWRGTRRAIWNTVKDFDGIDGRFSHWGRKLEWARTVKEKDTGYDYELKRIQNGSSVGVTLDVDPRTDNIIRGTTRKPCKKILKFLCMHIYNKKEERKIEIEEERVPAVVFLDLPLVVRPDGEELLLGAHILFYVCKSMLVDGAFGFLPPSSYLLQWCESDDPYGLAEMQLSLMFDILYTKAAVTYTWVGCFILIVSPLATAAALLLFHFQQQQQHAYGHGGGDDDSISKVINVGISYALLSGTLALETISVARAIGSTWACALMYCCRWKRLLGAVTSLRRLIGAASKRRWSGSMGQYSLLRLCNDNRNTTCRRLAAMLGLRHWWNKLHCSTTVSITKHLKDQLKYYVNHHAGSRAIEALRSRVQEEIERANDSRKFEEWTLCTTLSLDYYYRSIFCWHVATDIYLSLSTKVDHNDELVETVQVLSNYMMFLLMVQPEMLAGQVVQEYCVSSSDLFEYVCSANNHQNQGGQDKGSPGTNDASRSRMPKELAEELIKPDSVYIMYRKFFDGPMVARELLRLDSDDMLKIIFRVWAEMLFYAAKNCSRDSHARQLNNGGEFITIVWLWARHQEERIKNPSCSGVTLTKSHDQRL